MLEATTRILVEKLAARVRSTVGALIPNGKPLSHIWYEESLNFGDSAIWCGQKQLLHVLKKQPVYECSDRSYDENTMRRRLGSEGLILLRGGGNFGDIYGYHRLRLGILEAFSGNPIIQLPQTAFFRSNESLKETRRVLYRHQNVSLLARDEMTYDLFKKYFNSSNMQILICPDMAFMSGMYRRITDPVVDVVGLLRVDGESRLCADKGKIYNRTVEDELRIEGAEKRRYQVYNKNGRQVVFENIVLSDKQRHIELTDWYLSSLVSPETSPYHELDYLTKARLGTMMALTMLSRARVVVTDRLHAYILSLQLGIPHVVIDNSYGKLSTFYKTWGRESDETHFAGSVVEAVGIAREIARNAV